MYCRRCGKPLSVWRTYFTTDHIHTVCAKTEAEERREKLRQAEEQRIRIEQQAAALKKQAYEITMQAIERGELPRLDVGKEIILEEDEACRMTVANCACRWENAATVDMGKLYVTNKRLLLVGGAKSLNLSMIRILLSRADGSTIRLTINGRQSGLRLATGESMNDNLVAAAIQKLASMSRMGAATRKHPPPGSTPPEETRSTNNDPYVTLGVSHNASLEEISQAYHRMAQKYHPDKVASLGQELRELAERRMKEINAAYLELKRRAK